MNAFQESGASAVLTSNIQENPRRFIVRNGVDSLEAWIYIWTLTHGGRPSLPNELRIQMTGVESPLPKNPSGVTLLLGYHPDTGVFCGFDLQRHTEFTTGSPSVQVGLRCINQALQDGLAFDRKSNQEIVVALRAEQLVSYAIHAAELHKRGQSSELLPLLERAAGLELISDTEVADLSEHPRRVLMMVSRLARSASFRHKVLSACDHRCAVTRMQLKLVDAAHILPVQAADTVDDICNGIALSPSYHRAFDNSLIYLDSDYIMRINQAKADELSSLKLAGGIDSFMMPLEKKIHLPFDERLRPDRSMIEKANRFRGIGAH